MPESSFYFPSRRTPLRSPATPDPEAVNCLTALPRRTRLLEPDGILRLVDLDYTCMSQFGLPSRLAEASAAVMAKLREEAEFDPRVGAKLYSMLYDLGFRSLDVKVEPNHLIFGELDSVQEFDWTTRVEVVFKNSGYEFGEYEDGYDGFFAEFKASFTDPRRFFYTPLICCRGGWSEGIG